MYIWTAAIVCPPEGLRYKNPRSPPVVFFFGWNLVEAQTRLVSLPVSAAYITTTIWHFGKTKVVPNQMYHLFPVLTGSAEQSFVR